MLNITTNSTNIQPLGRPEKKDVYPNKRVMQASLIALACLQGVAAYYLGWTGVVLQALTAFQTEPSFHITATIASLLAASIMIGAKAINNVYCAYA